MTEHVSQMSYIQGYLPSHLHLHTRFGQLLSHLDHLLCQLVRRMNPLNVLKTLNQTFVIRANLHDSVVRNDHRGGKLESFADCTGFSLVGAFEDVPESEGLTRSMAMLEKCHTTAGPAVIDQGSITEENKRSSRRKGWPII
jgi:hypothetical protein